MERKLLNDQQPILRLSTVCCAMRSLRAVVLLLALLTVSATASAYVVGEYFIKDHITYRVIDASASNPKLAVYNVRGVSGTVTIPAKVFDGKDVYFTVTQIGGALDSNDPIRWDDTVTGVNLPNTITTLGNYCFAFSGITSLTLPASVTTIDSWANVLMSSCDKLKEILVASGNTSFISDDGVLYTKGHKELICLPSGKDFSATGNSYTINSNTEKVHVHAIGPASTLQKLVISASVNDIYMNQWPTFSYHPLELKEIEVDPNNATYCSIDGVVYNKDKTKLIYYPSGKTNATFKVPDGVTSIPYGYAIYCNNFLKSIDFNQVDFLKDFSIVACYNLSEIYIPKTLTTIGEGTFNSFLSLKKYIVDPANPNYSTDADGVLFDKNKTTLLAYPPAREGVYTIPNTVTKIGKQAFMRAKLTTLTIPTSVFEIGADALRETKLNKVTFEEPSKVVDMHDRQFLWCYELKTITLPKSLKILGNTFNGCKNLEIVNAPDGSQLEQIYSNAFVGCDNLTNFNFLGSSKLKTIGGDAFANLPKLKEFNFPATVTNIGANAFGNTPSMAKVTFDDNSTVISFGEGAFSNSGIKSIKIPASVKSINKDAFKNCNVLERVDVPAGCTNIHPEAFKFDTKLANINVDATNPKYSSVQGILLNKSKNELLIFPPGKARTDFTLLPPSITKIGDYAFYEGSANFTNIVIPAKVNTIGIRAFGLNPALKTVTLLCDKMIPSSKIDQGTNTMSFDDGTVASDKASQHITVYVRKSLLAQYQADPFWKKFTLKPSFTVNAEGTTSSTDEYIPTSGNTVDFLSTTADVQTFVLPKEVVYNNQTYKVGLIGDYAFENANPNMKEVVVKADVDYIGAMAFVTKTKRVAATNTISPESTSIKQVVFTGNTPATELSKTYFSLDAPFSEFFRGATGVGACEQNIYVKKSKLDTYKSVWTDYASALDYKIAGDGAKDFKVATKYGTFAREFDVDFSDYQATKIAAFVAGTAILKGGGDYGTSTYHVHMTSIDENGGVNGNYGYVPAGTGVLLKVLGQEAATPSDFYYTIGEQDDRTFSIADNKMAGVTINSRSVAASPTSPVYVMQGGVFLPAKTTIANFPAHKAYANLGTLPAGAKVMFAFDDGTITAIDGVAADEAVDRDAYYNLQGQRVERPQKGVYIHGGKKVIIK